MTCYRTFYVRDVSGDVIQVPCGQCIGCRLERARQWAVRCVHESQLHSQNCFVTLTYSNENLPQDNSVSKRDLQLFFKRLRNQFPVGAIRFYACGEYGERFNRPHYHACIFGIDFDDKTLLKESRLRKFKNHFSTMNPFDLYRSSLLEKAWPKGYSTIGSMSFESAGYVARYCMKKITGQEADKHYQGRNPEFALMSRRPGIGALWYERYKTDVYPKDFFTINGKKNRPPRYYDTLLARDSPDKYLAIKTKRAEEKREEETFKRKQQIEYQKSLVTKQLRREIEING